MYNKKALRRFLPGGINDGGGWDFPSGTFKPFDLGSGFAAGVGTNSSAYNQYSQQQQFENNLFGTKGPSAAPKPQQNPFANVNFGTGSYAETKDTGHTLGNQGQEIIPQSDNVSDNNEEESDLVIQEREALKKVKGLRGEDFVNVFNNVGIRYPVGIANNIQKNKQDYQLQLDTQDPVKMMGSTTQIDEGDYVALGQRVGQFRDPSQGQTRNSRSTFGNFAGDQQISKYGGFMQEGGSSGYKVGQTVEMEPWQLEQFLAAGGEVDYI
jgi:hypothetical protein